MYLKKIHLSFNLCLVQSVTSASTLSWSCNTGLYQHTASPFSLPRPQDRAVSQLQGGCHRGPVTVAEPCTGVH